MILKSKIFRIFLLLSLILAFKADIIPDPVQPIKIVPPITSVFETSGTTLEFNFSTDTDFQGLSNNQVISIQFDPTSSIFLENNYSCKVEIRDAPNGLLLGSKASTIYPNSDDKQSALCIIDNEPDLVGGVAYYFNVKLVINNNVPVHKLRAVWVAFSNSTSKNRTLIHPQQLVMNTPNFDVGTDLNRIFSINSITKENLTNPTNCSNPCGKLYPYSKFKMTFEITVNNYFKTNTLLTNYSALIGFSWPNSDFDFTSAYITTDSPTISDGSLLQGPLLGTITLQDHLGIPNTKIISGLTEDMYENRKFKIIIHDVYGPDYVTTTIQNNSAHLTFIMFHKNDYARYGSISTKEFIAEPLFKVNLVDILTVDNTPAGYYGISQADNQNIYENASWPIRFVFTIPPMPNGGYITIQHDYSTYKIFNFISSTCDFSDGKFDTNLNSIFSGVLGTRPICFPLEFTLTQTSTINSVSTTTVNSGVYFKVPSTTTYKTLSIVIWGVATKCSENDYLNSEESFHLDILNSTDYAKSYKTLSFTIKAYKSIDQSTTTKFSTENMIASKENIPMYGKCFGNLISHKSSHNTYNLSLFYSDPTVISVTKDVLLFKEVNDWNFSQLSVTNDLKFTSSSNHIFLSNLSAETDLEFGITGNLINFPVPAFISSSSLNYIDSTFNFFISKGFVTKKTAGFSSCKLQWLNSNMKTVGSTSAAESIIINDSTDQYELNILDEALTGSYPSNFITFSNPLKLSSKNDAFTSSGLKFINNIASTSLGFTTNCYNLINFQTNAKIKNIYSYIEFSYNFERTVSSEKVVNRATRFIKLLPLSGGFFSATDSNNFSENYTNSVFYFAFSSGSEDLCLLKLSSELFNAANNKNVLVVTLLNIRLLEVDIDYSSLYPVAPILSSVGSYSSNTNYPFSFTDAKTHSGLLNKQYLSSRSIIVNPYNYSNYVKDPSLNDYYDYFGSTLYFYNSAADGKFTDSSTNVDTFLPVYCPKGGEMLDNLDHLSFIVPSLSAFAIGFNNGDSFDITVNANPIKYVKFNLNSSNSNGIGKVALLFNRNILEPATSNLVNKINTYFSEYSINTISVQSRLYIKGSVPVNGIPPETSCNSITIFMSDLITTNNSITFTNSISSTIINKFYNENARTNKDFGFYYRNKKFQKAFYYGISSGETAVKVEGTVVSTSDLNSLSGINRPEITSYTVSNPNLTDDIFFNCIKTSSTGDGLFYNNYDSVKNSFVTEFVKLNSDSAIWTITTSLDVDQGTIYKDDKVHKLDINISVPSLLPKIAKLHINSSQLTADAICSINNINSLYPATFCGIVANNSIICPLTNSVTQILTTETLNVCCYNLSLKPNTEIVFKSTTKIVLDDQLFSTAYFLRDIITGEIDNTIDIETGYIPISNSFASISTVAPSVLGLYHDQVSHLDGLGILYIQINLGRPAVPNQIIKLTSKLNSYFINSQTINGVTVNSIPPNCEFYYNNNTPTYTLADFKRLSQRSDLDLNTITDYELGNYLVDKCTATEDSVGGINEANITLYNKNYIHKCKSGFSISNHSYVVVKLYPVFIKAPAATTYSLNSAFNEFTSSNYINGTGSTTLPSITYLNTSTVQTPNNICNVFNILPNTIGSLADYIFKINLSTITNFTNVPNEITIYFDIKKFSYPNTLDNIACYLDNSTSAIKWCKWERSGYFNIGLNSNLEKGKVYYLKISNMINGHLDSNYFFRCSLNKFAAASYSNDPDNRKNEIVSYGSNNYVNYFDLIQPDNSFFYKELDYPKPNNVPYLQVYGPNSDGKYNVDHISTQVREQNDFVLYLIYKSVGAPLVGDMNTNFEDIKTKYANKITTHGNLRFVKIDLTTQKSDPQDSLEQSFTLPSFRFIMPNGYLYTDVSQGTELSNFINDSLDDYLYNNVWPNFILVEDQNPRQIRLDYIPTLTLLTTTPNIKVYLIIDSTTSMTAEETALRTMFTNLSLGTITKKEIVLDAYDYELYNMQTITAPSVRVVMPDGLIRMFTTTTDDLSTFITNLSTNYYSYTDITSGFYFPIYKIKMFLIIRTKSASDALKKPELDPCRKKISQDLQASFKKFKEYYQALSVLSSQEIQFYEYDVDDTANSPTQIDLGDSNYPPTVAIYLPDGRHFNYNPTLPASETSPCPHYNHYYDIKNLAESTMKKYTNLNDLKYQLSTVDAAVVFLGNSSRDRDIFDLVMIQSSVYLPYYYCTSLECMQYFYAANGDVIFVNSKKQVFDILTTNIRILGNGYTSNMLSKFIKFSYAPQVSELNSEVMYQIFYKRTPAIFITIVDNDKKTNNLSVANDVSTQLRVIFYFRDLYS